MLHAIKANTEEVLDCITQFQQSELQSQAPTHLHRPTISVTVKQYLYIRIKH